MSANSAIINQTKDMLSRLKHDLMKEMAKTTDEEKLAILAADFEKLRKMIEMTSALR